MFFKWVIRDKVERCSVIIPVSYISYRVRASTQHVRIVFGLFIAFSIILRGYLAFASVKMPPKKKKRSCPFSSSKPRAKKKSKSEFDKEWAAKLAESDKGSFYQQEKLLEELDIQKSENAAVTAPKSSLKNQMKKANQAHRLHLLMERGKQ